MGSEDETTALEGCRAWLDRVVDVDPRAGIYDEANIREALEEIVEISLGESDPALVDEYATKVHAALEAQAAIEATWAARTANDAIDDAFADLNARGILAVQGIGNTVQEGGHKVHHLGLDRGGDFRGQVFYHRQDLERAVDGGGLWLAFDTFRMEDAEDRDKIAAIGAEVMHVLAHHGVGATWSGSAIERILIKPFAWQKRRTTQAPPGRGPAPAAPPPVEPEAPCEVCGGKGWVQASATDFPEKCVCRGGKPKPRASKGKGGDTTSEPLPMPGAPTDARVPDAAADARDGAVVSEARVESAPPGRVAPRAAEVVAEPAERETRVLAPGHEARVESSAAPSPGAAARFLRASLPVVVAAIIFQLWKSPPIGMTAAMALFGLGLGARAAWARS